MIPSVFVTAKHYNSGLKRDAASAWIEDVTQSSCKVCLRELQNYAGSHQDVVVVSNANLMESNEQRFSLETKCSRLVSFSIYVFSLFYASSSWSSRDAPFCCLKIYFPPSVSSSSGFVNLTMLLLSCNLRCRWLFYINLVERLPFIFYFRR